MSDTEVKSVRELLAPMITEAKQKGLWLHSNYQDQWFPPEELEAHNANGKFLWGPVNWTLRSPQEKLDACRRRVIAAQKEEEDFAKRIKSKP